MFYKYIRSGFSALLLSLSLVFSPFVFAQSAMDYFNQGVKEAESGKYSSALMHFQKAKKAGLDSASLQYNFGVAYYKLGQYEKAKQAFMALTKVKKYKQVAYYNLGLVANKQKDKAASIAWFQRAFQSGKSEKIQILSREALKRLGAEPKKSSATKNAWTGIASTSFASDSNVTLEDDTATKISDTSIMLSGYGANWLKGDRSGGFRLFLRGYLQNYNTETNYNYTLYGAGLARHDRFGDWYTRVGGFWDETNLGGSPYQSILSAEARARKNLSRDNQLRLRYRVSQINVNAPGNDYYYLDGVRQQLRAGVQTRKKTGRFRAYYQLELNDREDYSNPLGTTYTFKSYSPTRQTFRVTGWWDVTSLWELRLDGRYRTSQYNDDHILTSSATETRKDTQTRLSARLRRQLDKNMQLEMAYTATKNDSSIDAESYDRDLAKIGLVWKF